MTFEKIESGYYYCLEYPQYSIKKKGNALWIGYNSEKVGTNVCCCQDTLKNCKKVMEEIIREQEDK